jgi:hypothetical protein
VTTGAAGAGGIGAARAVGAAGATWVAGTAGATGSAGSAGSAGFAGAAGALFEPGDAADLRRWIDRLIGEPELLASWQRRLPPVKGADEHAEEIEEIYRRVVAAGAAR